MYNLMLQSLIQILLMYLTPYAVYMSVLFNNIPRVTNKHVITSWSFKLLLLHTTYYLQQLI